MTLAGPSADEWDRLATDASNIFATRAWHDCWWKHFGNGATPIVVTDNEQCPTIIVALYAGGRTIRQVRLVGHGPGDELGAVCTPEHRDEALSLLQSTLKAHGLKWDVLIANDVPVADGWAEKLDAVELRRVASPVVRFETNVWDDFLRGKSKNFREQLRRKERKLNQNFDVKLRLADAATLRGDLATLFDLHRRRWGSGAYFASGPNRPFHAEFAAIALDREWLRLWVLELDGKPAAALYGFRFAGVEYFHQSGRDPALDEHSVGSVLLVHAVRAALEDGMSEYRLLRGEESYKSRLADVDRPVYTFAVANSLLGRAAVRAARMRRR